MKYYIVKTHMIATPENESFAGQEETTYYGTKEYVLARYGSHPEAVHSYKPLYPYWVKEYGYKTLAVAKRNLFYRSPVNSKNWITTSADIICIDLPKGCDNGEIKFS